MKNPILILLLLVCTLSVGQEMEYFQGSIAELKAAAKKSKKPFFVDFYTDWCGYCKKMDASTFRDPEVLKLVEKHFLAYKLNAEKGEGPTFTRENVVTGYPTVKVFNSKGEVVGTLRGFVDSQRFINELSKYIESKPSKKETAIEQSYWSVKSKFFQELEGNVSEKWKLNTEWYEKSQKAGTTKQHFEFDELLLDAELAGLEEYVLQLMKIHFALGIKKFDDVEELVNGLFVGKQCSPVELHYFALLLYKEEQVTLPVLVWMNNLVTSEPSEFNLLDSKAAIQLAYGDTEDALETAKKAKKIASKNKLDATSSMILIQEAQ